MEKNKGLFSFRKHPVGDFLDEKKGRKRKGGRLRRSMGFLMAAALIFNTLPASGLAVSASEQEKGLCEHHPEHTAECGYAEAQPCTHEHTEEKHSGEECYKTVTECVHEHTDECYPETEETEESAGEGNATASDAEGREPENCTHKCSEESGCITKVLDCHHEHGESCGYKEAQDCGYVCEICNGTEPEDTKENTENTEAAGIDTAECICEILCTEDSINGDCPVCGADDASFLDCKGKVSEENTENQEDTGICKHHQEHDADCGYIPKSEDGEGSPCTYKCRICPVEDLIAALPDKVTEDNEEEVRAQLEEILALYGELDEDEQAQIDISRCLELQEALDEANAPVQLATGNVMLSVNNGDAIFTAEECGDNCQGHIITQNGGVVNATILVKTGTHNITFQGLNLTEPNVGVMPGATMNLTLGGNNTIKGYRAGIYVPNGAILTIGGDGSLNVSGNYAGAGIGGAFEAPDGSDGDPNCGTVEINGGTITATGGSCCAGIGGGTTDDNPGNGGTVTINGGMVTATGGSDGNYSGAGIGGAGGLYDPIFGGISSGCGGSLTINGGHVTLAPGQYDPQWSTAYGFGRGSSENTSGGMCELTLADAGYLTVDSLDPNGKYTINGNPTADMIVVPEELIYNGKAQELDGKIYIDDSKTGSAEYFGRTFSVKASAEGWELQPLGEVKAAGEYTAVFKKGDKEISKTFTVAKSGTDLKTKGKVLTYNGDTQTTTFNADDTITVKATPTATGTAPAKAAARLRGSYTEPTTGQMALFVGDVQVSEPVQAGEGGTYTMTVSAAEVLLQGNAEQNGNAVTLTAKFIGNDNMADGQGTATVNITAVAVAEKDGKVIGYYGESGLDAALADKNNEGAVFTLLDNMERETMLYIKIDCTLDLNGKTIRSTGEYVPTLSTYVNTAVTIRGEGTVISEQGHGFSVGGTTTLEGGTFISGAANYGGVYVQTGKLIVTGDAVVIENTGGGTGLGVGYNAEVQLSGGTYEGGTAAIEIYQGTGTLAGLLNQEGTSRVAYYKDNTTLVTEGLDGQTLPSGSYTVKACTHAYQYAHTPGTTTHSQTCPACGDAKISENCSYDAETGRCACGSTLAVTLSGAAGLVYNGSSHTPDVTVTLDGTELTAGTDYTVVYVDNVNAGTDTAAVTVTGNGNYRFEIKKTFSIEKAEQENFAVEAVTKPYEKNGTFTLSTTGEGGDGAVLYRVPENNGILMVNGDQATIIGVGTVTVTAIKAESVNYKAATATGKITITKASAPHIIYPTAAGSITYGQKLSDCVLTGGSTEYGTFAWENGSMIPTVDNTGYTVVFTASKETEKNYETITDTTQNVSVIVEKAVPAVSVTAAVSGSKDNRQAVLTVNVAKAGAGAFPTGTVTFIDCTGSTEVEIGTATLSNGSASYTWDGLQDKTYTIKAVYKGNNNYTEAESREAAFDAAKQNQQDFSLDAIGAKTYGDAAVTLKTIGGSGSGAVRYESSDADVIRIEDGRAVITGAGTATITAIKEGDDNYNEASASRNVTVAKKALTVRADSKTVVRGNTMPALTYRAEGLVNGDTFTTAPSITAGTQNTDTLGKYDIVISGGTLRNSESYSITYVNGTLNIVERFYTVTVTDGTGGGEYAEGETVTVTANDRSGYTFTGWSSGDGVAFADSKAKNTTFTMPAKSVTVKANYTRNSSGGNTGGGSGDGGNSGGSGSNSGGNSGGNGNNGGGGSTNPGNGNTTPQPSVTQPADTNTNPGNETALGTGTTPAGPGSGNTVRPGTAPGSGTGTPAQGTKQPFIKGADGKIGWDVIRAEEEQAQEGSTINVDMNGSVVVPGDIFDSIKGKDITITFDMGNGIIWSVDGKSITTDKAGDIDFSVKTETNAIPVDIVNNVTGERYSIQISLSYEGEFDFTAVLSIGLGRENAGYTASLYYYNESTGELEFICSDEVAEDGTVSLAFTHASDYVIAIDGDGEEESGNATEPEQPDTPDKDSTGQAEEIPQAGQAWRPWWLIVVGALVVIMGIGVFFVVKKGKDGDSGQ